MSDTVVSADGLDANRSGQLTVEQQHRLRDGLDRKHSGLTGLIGRAADPLVKDLKAGRVDNSEGAATKSTQTMGYGVGSAGVVYRIQVANRERGTQELRSPKDIYDVAPDAGMVRLCYLPRSRWVVNLERLPGPPVHSITGEEGARQALPGWAAARQAHDKAFAAPAADHGVMVECGLAV